jgi:hypothetical protein
MMTTKQKKEYQKLIDAKRVIACKPKLTFADRVELSGLNGKINVYLSLEAPAKRREAIMTKIVGEIKESEIARKEAKEALIKLTNAIQKWK